MLRLWAYNAVHVYDTTTRSTWRIRGVSIASDPFEPAKPDRVFGSDGCAGDSVEFSPDIKTGLLGFDLNVLLAIGRSDTRLSSTDLGE
jgi:hypothetical protein